MKRLKKLCKRCNKNFATNKFGYCYECNALFEKTKALADKESRPSSTERGYDWEWKQFSKKFLENHPVCVRCGAPATITDHKIPIQVMTEVWGENILDENFYQPLCVACNAKKYWDTDKKMIEEWQRQKELIPQ
jgi:5-methylcytosine-specific restriction endonuclease McrA